MYVIRTGTISFWETARVIWHSWNGFHSRNAKSESGLRADFPGTAGKKRPRRAQGSSFAQHFFGGRGEDRDGRGARNLQWASISKERGS